MYCYYEFVFNCFMFSIGTKQERTIGPIPEMIRIETPPYGGDLATFSEFINEYQELSTAYGVLEAVMIR